MIQVSERIKKMIDLTFTELVDGVKAKSFSAVAAERADQVQTAVAATMVSLAALINV